MESLGHLVSNGTNVQKERAEFALRRVAKAAEATPTKERVDATPTEETATEEIAAAPAEPRRETRQRKSEAIVDSTPEQPTQGLA